jgi:hypothetical protein
MAIALFSPQASRARTDDTTNINDTASSQPNARAFRFRILSLDVVGEDENVVTRQYNLIRPNIVLRKVASTLGHFRARVSQPFSGLRRPSPYEVNLRCCPIIVANQHLVCVRQLLLCEPCATTTAHQFKDKND